MYRKLTTAAAVAALTLGLAACGGGGGDDTADAPTTMEPIDPTPTPAEEIATLQAEINALRAELGLDPIDIDDLTGSVSDLEGQVADLTQQVADRDTAMAEAEAEKMRMEMAATGRLLYGALAGNATADSNALANISPPGLTPAGLTITPTAGAGTFAAGVTPPAATLTAGDSVGSLGSWAGTMYSHTIGTGPNKVTNEAVVYNNRGAHAGPSRPFTEVYGPIITSGPTRGYVQVATADAATTGFAFAAIRAEAFTHSGVQTHTAPSGMTAFTTPGTYDGAPGTYRCEGADCTSTNDGRSGPTSLGGTWLFKPDAGAMTSPADTTYLYYGWWVSKDSDDEPTAASAFASVVFPTGGSAPAGVDGSTITGSATYAGHAAGKFAIHRTADGSNNGGHFTADATLAAKFGGTTVDRPGMTGTIDNFRLNDGSEDPGWSVKLNRGTWAATGEITAPATAPTVWSINGNAASASGSWSGQMYDEKPGLPSVGGDGSNVPTTVTGTFYSQFGSTHRMVGGFAAEKQ